MRVLTGRNVNHLFQLGMNLLAEDGERRSSRAGDVIVVPYPVMSVYERPTERVLFSRTRDANPFFHLFEALWMLAGRNDAAPLDHYVKDFGSRFGETWGTDGKGGRIIHGAYGHRWRKAIGHDQLDAVVARLRADDSDRQCVIQMWDATPAHEEMGNYDHPKDIPVFGQDDLLGSWRDRPCNTHVYLRVRPERKDQFSPPAETDPRDQDLLTCRVLDLTVCCRSNDAVWGAHGANAVHFSFLQEYLAGRIGVGVGRMYQLSNNYHGYVDVLDRIGDPVRLFDETDPYEKNGSMRRISTLPIGERWDVWDDNLVGFMRWHDLLWMLPRTSDAIDMTETMSNLWFNTVAVPMCQAHWLYRQGRMSEAMDNVVLCESEDWAAAGLEWLMRRRAAAKRGDAE